jgi:hypothetical protein
MFERKTLKKVSIFLFVALIVCLMSPMFSPEIKGQQTIEIWALSTTDPPYPVVIAMDRKVLMGAPIFENLEHYRGTFYPYEPILESFDIFVRDMIRDVSTVPLPSVAVYEPDLLETWDEWLAAPNDWTFLMFQVESAKLSIQAWTEQGYISGGDLISNLTDLFTNDERAYDVLILDQCFQADTPIFTADMIQLVQNFLDAGGGVIVSGSLFVDWASIVRLLRGEPDLPYWFQGPINDDLLLALFPEVGLDRRPVVVQVNGTEEWRLATTTTVAVATDIAPTTVTLIHTYGVEPYALHGFMKIQIARETKTMGYWKNHPEAWIINSVTIGGVTYSKEEATAILKQANAKDATYMLVAQLIAAKLNLANGLGWDYPDIDLIIADADAFLVAHPIGSNPKGADRDIAIILLSQLDAFNNYIWP